MHYSTSKIYIQNVDLQKQLKHGLQCKLLFLNENMYGALTIIFHVLGSKTMKHTFFKTRHIQAQSHINFSTKPNTKVVNP